MILIEIRLQAFLNMSDHWITIRQPCFQGSLLLLGENPGNEVVPKKNWQSGEQTSNTSHIMTLISVLVASDLKKILYINGFWNDNLK